MTAFTLAGHVLGLTLWLGGLLAGTLVMVRHERAGTPEAQWALGTMEVRLLNGLATPGAALTVATGIILVALDSHYYLHAVWLYAKLALVLMLGGLHVVAYSRCRALRDEVVDLPRPKSLPLFYAVVLVFVVILLFALPGEVYLH